MSRGDYTVVASCGCMVVFHQADRYEKHQYTACKKHGERTTLKEQDAIVAFAKRQRDKNCHHASN